MASSHSNGLQRFGGENFGSHEANQRRLRYNTYRRRPNLHFEGLFWQTQFIGWNELKPPHDNKQSF